MLLFIFIFTSKYHSFFIFATLKKILFMQKCLKDYWSQKTIQNGKHKPCIHCLHLFFIHFSSIYNLIFFFLFSLNFDSWNSKTNLKLIKTRLETIRKKRTAVQRFLKKDLADLLRNSLDYNAYGRVIIFYWFFFFCHCFWHQW